MVVPDFINPQLLVSFSVPSTTPPCTPLYDFLPASLRTLRNGSTLHIRMPRRSTTTCYGESFHTLLLRRRQLFQLPAMERVVLTSLPPVDTAHLLPMLHPRISMVELKYQVATIISPGTQKRRQFTHTARI
jgi:hypothetical protein